MFRLALAFLVIAIARSATAQVLILDEGTFTHSVGGTRVGREDFSVRTVRGGGAAVYIAQANVLAGENRRTIALNADSVGAPLRFQLEAREATTIVSTVVGERERSTWLGRVISGTRESGREFRLSDHTFVAEPSVVHHLWFVLRFGQGRPVILLTPSANAQDTVQLVEANADTVTVGTRRIAARRWELRDAQDGSVLWEFWSDAVGRLLRARDPRSGLDAMRDDPPGETPGR